MRNINKFISSLKNNNHKQRQTKRRQGKPSTTGRMDAMAYQVWGKIEEVKTKIGNLLAKAFSSPSSREMKTQTVTKRKTGKMIFMLAIATLMGSTLFTACDTSDQKAAAVQENEPDSMKTAQVQADEAYLADMKNYRKGTVQKLAVYNKDILTLKAGMLDQKQEDKADFRNRITALEQQSSTLKMKMDNYQESGKEQWEVFKTELDQEMDKLSKALNDSSTVKEL
jgi:hypothetical protein